MVYDIYEWIGIVFTMAKVVGIITLLFVCFIIGIIYIPKMLNDDFIAPWEKAERKQAKKAAKEAERAKKLNHWWEA